MLIKETESFQPRSFMTITIIYTLFSGIMIGLSELSRNLSPLLPLAAYAILTGISLYVILTYLAANDKKIVRYFAMGGAEIIAAMLLVAAIAATITFGLLCKEIHTTLGTGFNGEISSSFATWIGFGFDNLLEAVMLDAPEIYGFTFSNIRAENFSTQTLVLIFRSSVNLLILKTIIRYWRFIRNQLLATRI